MLNVASMSDRMARARLERRRTDEADRKERIFQDKVRTIGVDKEALDRQVEEKKRKEKRAEEEQNAKDAVTLQNSKVSTLLHNRQVKERRAIQQANVAYGQHCVQTAPECPALQTELEESQMMLPGLVGMDAHREGRKHRQQEQLRDWLTQQQIERAAERRQRELEEQCYVQSKAEMDRKALWLDSMDAERRKEAAVATKAFNLAEIEERRRKEEEYCASNRPETVTDANPSLGMLEILGDGESSDMRAPTESVQQIIQFHKSQVEEKKRKEMEKKHENDLFAHMRLGSARSAILIERQQARLDKQIRQHLDSVNVELAQMRKQKPDIERGHIDERFFSQFNTCSR